MTDTGVERSLNAPFCDGKQTAWSDRAEQPLLPVTPSLVPPPADGVLVSTQRVENSSSTLTQEFVSHTVMASGTLTQHVERQFYEA